MRRDGGDKGLRGQDGPGAGLTYHREGVIVVRGGGAESFVWTRFLFVSAAALLLLCSVGLSAVPAG